MSSLVLLTRSGLLRSPVSELPRAVDLSGSVVGKEREQPRGEIEGTVRATGAGVLDDQRGQVSHSSVCTG